MYYSLKNLNTIFQSLLFVFQFEYFLLTYLESIYSFLYCIMLVGPLKDFFFSSLMYLLFLAFLFGEKKKFRAVC